MLVFGFMFGFVMGFFDFVFGLGRMCALRWNRRLDSLGYRNLGDRAVSARISVTWSEVSRFANAEGCLLGSCAFFGCRAQRSNGYQNSGEANKNTNPENHKALPFNHRSPRSKAPATTTGARPITARSIGVSSTGHSRSLVDGHSHPGYGPCEKSRGMRGPFRPNG